MEKKKKKQVEQKMKRCGENVRKRERIMKETETEEAINSVKEDKRIEHCKVFNWGCLPAPSQVQNGM